MSPDPATTFEPHRRRLRGLAYRMLGSIAEAEDVVQETYLRWHAAARGEVHDPAAFLTTIATRLCLDVLKSARARREEYVGPWLPDPVVDTAALAPDAQTALADDLSVALLLALDRLSALERAAFLLHDVFDASFADVASALNRSEAACRQLASRARTRVRRARPALPSSSPSRAGLDPRHLALLDAFGTAARTGDLESLTRMLARDAQLVTDSGGKVPAAMNVIDGADHIARFLTGVVRKGWTDDMVVRPAVVSGLPALLLIADGRVVQTTAFQLEGDVVTAIYVVRNPDKLRHVLAG
jgi:RNA polymerase sigma-70 factor (ECF subfamily)